MTALVLLIIAGIALGIWLVKTGRVQLPGDPDYIDPTLLNAAGGNRALAKRLLEQVKLRYPDKSERWYTEKVIYDLNRDHGVAKGRGHSWFDPRTMTGREARDKLILVGAVLWVFNSVTSTIRNLTNRH